MIQVGGSKIIQSFLKMGIVDSLIITICPRFIGNGVHAVSNDVSTNCSATPLPDLTNISYEEFGNDLVLSANVIKKG